MGPRRLRRPGDFVKRYRLLGSAPDVAGMQKVLAAFWPDSGVTVDAQTLTIAFPGKPVNPRFRVIAKKGRLRFEVEIL